MNIFNHIDNITYKKTPFEKYTEQDIKSWTTFIINRFLSMHIDLTEFINEFQYLTIGHLEIREIYKLYSILLPKQKLYLSYIKGKKEEKYNKELIIYLVKYFQLSTTEIKDYLELLYQTKDGKDEIRSILGKYGLEKKVINKLIKLK